VNKRITVALILLGASLLVLAVCLPGIPILLHRNGFIHGWSGFGLFFLGMTLWPWMIGFGLLFIAIAISVKRKNWKSRSGKVGFAVLIASVVCLAVVFAFRLPRMFPTESSRMPRELTEGVVAGNTKFVKELFYRQPGLGIISDIEPGQSGQIMIAGRLGAVWIGSDRALSKAYSYEQCLSDVMFVKLKANKFSFLCRGDYGKDQNTKLFDAGGKTLWSYGENSRGVFDATGGDLGKGVEGIVVALSGDGGLQFLDLAGSPVWRREDSDIRHVEIATLGGNAPPAILHSDTQGQLTVRNGNGDVLAHVAYPGMFLGKFSLTAWGSDPIRDKLLVSHSDRIYVLSMDGKTIASLQAPMYGHRGQWTTYGTPLPVSANVRYYAALQHYDEWNRSVLRIYDDQNRRVYEEVLADNCATLRALPNKRGSEDLLLGCDGKVLRYTLPED
jgi:hypothetical protein